MRNQVIHREHAGQSLRLERSLDLVHTDAELIGLELYVVHPVDMRAWSLDPRRDDPVDRLEFLSELVSKLYLTLDILG